MQSAQGSRPMYSLRYQLYPSLEAEAEVRSLIVERVRRDQSDGVRSTALAALVSESGPAVVAVYQFDHLAGMEGWMERNEDDTQRGWLAKIQPLLRQPTRQNLYEDLLLAQTGPAQSASRYVRRIV